MAETHDRIEFHLRKDPLRCRAAGESVVFFGNTLGPACQRCGGYDQTDLGHKYCAFVSCPIALIEFKRRQRKRTSTLEKVIIPRIARPEQAHAPASPESGASGGVA